MTSSATYKPSPLSFGSPRSSPFRRPESRPESPASPSTVRATTPTHSPTKPHTPIQSPPKASAGSWTPRGMSTPLEEGPMPSSPKRGPSGANRVASPMARMGGDNGNALGKLSAAQVRELREGYQLLDRDSDGQVGREDVVDMLNNLGQDSNPSTVSTFFPPGTSQTIALPHYLTQLSTLLAPLSPPEELISAFAAFDEDDGGQVDLAELRDAVLHTAPAPGDNTRMLSAREIDTVMSGFTGRKMFGKHGGGRGEVFKYQEFVAAITGGSAQEGAGKDGGK